MRWLCTPGRGSKGDTVQTTLLGLAIAFILALIAALVGPYFIDWNQFRPQFEAEATRIIGAPVRIGGELDARLLPAPQLRLRSAVVGGGNDRGKVRADKLDVEFSLGSLMRGEWRATELTINGMSVDLGLDQKGRIEWPASQGAFDFASLAIDRLNLTGRIALHDAASHSTLELSDIAFSGDVRSLAGAIRGDGNFTFGGSRYPFRISSGQSADGNGTRVHVNIDPGQRPLSADLDGVLSFEARAPRFEGVVALAAPPASKNDDAAPTPWRVGARVKADYSAARLEQVEISYGNEERALKLAGVGDIRFGASPLLRASLSARQLDVDRFASKDNNAEPVRALPALRALLSSVPRVAVPSQIEFSSEQIMLGGRPLQDIAAELRGDDKGWTVRRLDFRAPGATRVSLSGAGPQNAQSDSFKAALNVESSDPDALMVWLQGRSDLPPRNQKPLKLRGDVTLAANAFAVDAMKAEIDGGAITGRIAVSYPTGNTGAKVDANVKADRLDLDAATAVIRSLAGPQAEWPEEAQLSLDIGRAISAGQELRPLQAKLGYGPKMVSLERLKIGQPDNVTIEGSGNFDRINATGKLALDANAASFSQLTGLVSSFAPSAASRLTTLASIPGPVRVKLALDLDKGQADRGSLRVALDLHASQLKGSATVTAKPQTAAIRSTDLDALGRSDLGVEARFSAVQGRAMLTLLGLDRVITVGDGPAQFEGSVNGAWRAPLRLKARIWGAGLDADAEGSAEPWDETKASINLRVRSADISPLLDLKPSDTPVNGVRLSSRVSLTGNKLSFDDLDSIIGGSRLRGRVALGMGDEKNIEGEIGLDQVALAPVFAFAIGAGGHDPAEPLGGGVIKGWRGNIVFQSLRGELPGGAELQPVSGTIKSDGQALTFDALKGKIGGGDLSAAIDARPGPNGVTVNASVQLSGVDGTALRYRNLSMPKGRASLQMTLMSQGRSAAALTGALNGSGTVTLEGARVAGLDPHAFDIAIRASENGQVSDDARLKQIVEPALANGVLSVASAQIPFNIRDGRLRVGATTLAANGVNATISGGYDIPADQADIRAALVPTAITAASRPEIQLFAVGTPDGLTRSVDVAALSSWLAVRAIDRETRRLDAIERGEPPPTFLPTPPLIPPQEPPEAPDASAAIPPPSADVPLPGRDPRKGAQKSKTSAPRPPQVQPPASTPSANPPASVASQPQLAPLPPPIDVRPPPGAAKPKPRPPLALTPQVANPPQRPAAQN
nr:AsmA-like C-terminal region-containing protein [Bradyrhizobium sp. BRP22]